MVSDERPECQRSHRPTTTLGMSARNSSTMLRVEARRFGNCSAVVTPALMNTGTVVVKVIAGLPRVPKIGGHAP